MPRAHLPFGTFSVKNREHKRFHVSFIVVKNQQQITVSFEQTYDYKAHNCLRVHFSEKTKPPRFSDFWHENSNYLMLFWYEIFKRFCQIFTIIVHSVMRRSSMIVNCTIFNGFLLVCHTKNSDFDHHFNVRQPQHSV